MKKTGWNSILTIQKAQSASQTKQHVLQQSWRSREHVDSPPVPAQNDKGNWEVKSFQAHPNLCKTTVLIDDLVQDNNFVSKHPQHYKMKIDRI